MTARSDYIAHCESLGIHRSLAGLMADEAEALLDASWFTGLQARHRSASACLHYSFLWAGSEQGYDFWLGVEDMLLRMAATGECK